MSVGLSRRRLSVYLPAGDRCRRLVLVGASDLVLLVRVLLLDWRVLQVVIRNEGLPICHGFLGVFGLDQVLLNGSL